MAPLYQYPDPTRWGGDKGERVGSTEPKYVKTPKGIEEVEKRNHGLELKTRQVLIMVDGKRDEAAFVSIFGPEMVAPTLQLLLEGGFIRALEPPKPVAPPPPAPVKSAAPSASNDTERFTMARNFMLNTVSAFVGMAGSVLTDKIEQAMDLDTLAGLFHEWKDAISLTGDGKKRLPELEPQLMKLLVDVPSRAGAPASTTAPVAQKGQEPKTSVERPKDDEERLAMARNFMINTVNTFIGMAGSSLVDKVEQADTITELRHLYYDWKESLQLDKEGRQRLPELEKRLAALLS